MDIVERIEEALEGIRPYIASHKGSVEVIDFDPVEGHLLLRMGGTCQGCAAATISSSMASRRASAVGPRGPHGRGSLSTYRTQQ